MNPTFHTMLRQALVGYLGLLCLLPAVGFAQDPDDSDGLRIFISTDMEGIAGAVTPNQISAGEIDYAQYRVFLTNEVNAAIAGARKAGATGFVVADSHGNGQNLLVEKLPKDVRIVKGGSRPLIMMEGIQSGEFDGVMFIGYHSSAASLGGVRAHSFSSAHLSELKLNDVDASEGYWNAAIAGEFGAPVILVTGDNVAVDELQPVAANAERVAVKQAISFHGAETLTPEAACELIENAAERAVKNLARNKPFKVDAPVTVDITFHFYQPAEILSWLPGVQRTGSRSIRYQSANMQDATRFLAFMFTYNVNLQP
jgi:D-amino peptidase